MTKEQAYLVLANTKLSINDCKIAHDALDAAGAFAGEPTPNDTNATLLDTALASLDKASRALQNVDLSETENDHLISYAFDGIASAEGYLGTARRRCDDPESD